MPGVGQAVGAVIFSSAFAGTTAGFLATALIVGTTVASVVGGLGSGPQAPKAENTATSIKQSRPPRMSCYGEMRLYGAYILYETSPENRAIDVYAIHDGQMDGIVQIYLNDDKVTVDALTGGALSGGNVFGGADGRYSDNFLQFYLTDGRAPGTPILNVVSQLPGIWTMNHRGDGIVTMGLICSPVKADDFIKVYPNGVPTPSVAGRWQKCPDLYAADPTDPSGWTWTENVVRQFAHYKLVREKVDWTTKIAPTLGYWQSAQSVCDEAVPLKVNQTPITFGGFAGSGFIDVANPIGIVPGMAITISASDNPSHSEVKTVISITDHTVDFAGELAFNHPNGSLVYWTANGSSSEARYRSCISHQHTTRHAEVNNTFLASMDGWQAIRQDGAIVIYAGKYYTPTVTIDSSHIIAYDWTGVGVDDDEAVNEIVCSYVSKAHDYNNVECDAWRDEEDILERGQILSNSLEVQTPSWGQVRRLAKRSMARTNALYRGTVTTNTSGRIARGERYINLVLEEAGTVFYNGPAEITAVTRNISTGGITFSWVAVSPNIDAWNPATEEGEPAALGDRVAPEPLDTPVITTAVAEIGDDGSTARIRITVDGYDRTDITWYARWRVTTDTTWNEQAYGDIDPGPTAELLTNLVPLNVAIDVEVKYSIGDGRQSDWSPLVSVSTSTADLAPAPVSGFSVAGGTGSATANWTNPTSPGFADVQIRRNTTNNFGTSTLITTKAGTAGALDSYTNTGLSPATYYFWAVSRNASGIAGSPIASGAVTVL